jgi:hypothetical protein
LKIYYYLLLYFIITTALQGQSPLGLALYESAFISTIKVVETPMPKVGYKIPTGHVRRVMEHHFNGDESKSAKEHVEMIDDICSLFRLPGISEDEVRRTLLYLCLSGNAREWYKTLDKEVTTKWGSLMKVFFPKIFTPKESYENRCYILNFSPHVGESITQTLGRLKELIRKNPCHDLSRKIILINFYVRVPKQQKEFLDNSSGGSFTNNYEEEASNLLETISKNTGNWDLDKGNKPRLEYEYFCVENFSTSTVFEHLSDKFGLDPYVLV